MKKVTKILSILCVLTMVLTPVSVYASPSNGATQTTDISYTSAETEWTWSVPAAVTFTDSALSHDGTVSIDPVDDVIVLPAGRTIAVNIMGSSNGGTDGQPKLVKRFTDSANHIINGYDTTTNPATPVSAIPYTISMNGTPIAGATGTVLTFTAGTSANTGISQTLTFATTAENIQNAKLTGEHTDTITFLLLITN